MLSALSSTLLSRRGGFGTSARWRAALWRANVPALLHRATWMPIRAWVLACHLAVMLSVNSHFFVVFFPSLFRAPCRTSVSLRTTFLAYNFRRLPCCVGHTAPLPLACSVAAPCLYTRPLFHPGTVEALSAPMSGMSSCDFAVFAQAITLHRNRACLRKWARRKLGLLCVEA